MIRVIILASLLVGVSLMPLALESTGCTPVQPIVSDVIDCAKAEAVVVSDGFSITQIVMEVIAVLEGGPSGVLSALEGIIKTYGPDIVACVIDNYPEPAPTPVPVPPPGPGSGSGSSSPPQAATSQAVLNKHMALATLFANKKISHTTFKKKH